MGQASFLESCAAGCYLEAVRLPFASALGLWLAAGLAAAAGCSADEHFPPAAANTPSDGAAGTDGGVTLQPLPDAGVGEGPCGDQKIPATLATPNLYFIIDRSGSMRDKLGTSGYSKYESARIALSQVLRKVGHRVRYGAAVFPGFDGDQSCAEGREVRPLALGDPPSYARDDKNGPILIGFLQQLDLIPREGGTPLASSLRALLPELAELEERSYAVLITDGAPNCNGELACDAAHCIPNIEGAKGVGFSCTEPTNCCSPEDFGGDAGLGCVDDEASVAGVKALAEAGIRTFVVGMPGSEPYAALLNAMAAAGGTERTGKIGYYAVEDTAALGDALAGIAAEIAIGCELPLDYEPPNPELVNVYFDEALVVQDPTNGWSWTEDFTITLNGEACTELRAGNVLEVQIWAGCVTVVN